ncbi:MAG: AAA family ATPase [Methanobrevibacter sp.]|nr:AAA family ATPase [Candidatus Methanovirga basalitermitum]
MDFLLFDNHLILFLYNHLILANLEVISKNSKDSLFIIIIFNSSDDITLDYKYLNICGYTQEDLENGFNEHIKNEK